VLALKSNFNSFPSFENRPNEWGMWLSGGAFASMQEALSVILSTTKINK
jgi:hypothetical protein